MPSAGAQQVAPVLPLEEPSRTRFLRGGAMSKYVRWMILPVVAVLAACGGQDNSAQLDEALSRDLALAASMQYPQPQFMSPMEMGDAQSAYGQYPQQQLYDQYGRPVYAPQPVAQQAIYRAPAPAPARTTARASTGTTA